MTYATEKDRIGKEPFTVVGLVLDKCSLVHGIAPCTATETGDDKCFNTRATCNDPDNYDLDTQEYLYCDQVGNLPLGINMLPVISGEVKEAATTVTGGRGLGSRGIVTVTLKDMPHHDRGEDPYWDERTYNPETRGTYWGKKLTRNPYYEGRTLKVYHGFLTDPFSWDNFTIQEFDITDIDGPTKGMVRVTAKDILARTYGIRQKWPALSVGKLSANIAASAATATLTPAGIGNSDYPASGHVAIGREVKAFTRSADVLTFTAHGEYGTEDTTHSEGDVVQICITWTDENVVDTLYQALTDGAGLPDSVIPYDDGATGINENWDDEKEIWMSTYLVNGIIMKPEDIDKIIKEWSEQFMFDIWWNATDQEVRIKALAPETSGATINTLTDQYHLAKESVKVKRDYKQRFTEIQVWYDKIDFSESDKIENFSKAQISVDLTLSAAELYGSASIKVINSRWINDAGQALQLSGRMLSRYSDTPLVVDFEVYVKDDAKFDTAGRVNLDTYQIQDFSGLNDIRPFQVLEINPIDPGHKVKVRAISSSYVGSYWFISPDGIPDYPSATQLQKDSYAFICYDTGFFLDGESAYKIL